MTYIHSLKSTTLLFKKSFLLSALTTMMHTENAASVREISLVDVPIRQMRSQHACDRRVRVGDGDRRLVHGFLAGLQ